MRKPTRLPTRSGIVLFYPGRLLCDQISDWSARRGGCRTVVSHERDFFDIRRQARRAETAVIDASDDPAQAVDAFLQAVNILGVDSVAVYVEKTHEDLELFVRMMGAQLLLGPMSRDEWDGFLDHRFPAIISLAADGAGEYRRKSETASNAGDTAAVGVAFYRERAG